VLRFDFVTPNPPSPASPFYHHILTLPQELTKKRPKHSFIFNSYADPPTTTLRCIKAITTGSLPTFVDLGNNCLDSRTMAAQTQKVPQPM
jgi:phosphatidylinositol glycan class O